MIIRTILKNGISFDVKCEDFTTRTHMGQLINVSWEGVTGDKPSWVDISEVAAFIRMEEKEDS